MTDLTTKTHGLVLRVCDENLRSHGGFQWPSEIGAEVVAPDWSDVAECGNGLHGWLYGAGDSSCSGYVDKENARWLVVEVLLSEIVTLGGKVKFPRCTVRHIGDRHSATAHLIANDQSAKQCAVIGALVVVGDRQQALTGNYGTATAGNYGTATAGNYGTATAGYGGTATAGSYGTATAGSYGTATAGYGGTATAGEGGTATAGYGGTATAGEGGEIRLCWWDNKNNRYRTAVGYIGENGIKPNTKYRLDDDHAFAEAP